MWRRVLSIALLAGATLVAAGPADASVTPVDGIADVAVDLDPTRTAGTRIVVEMDVVYGTESERYLVLTRRGAIGLFGTILDADGAIVVPTFAVVSDPSGQKSLNTIRLAYNPADDEFLVTWNQRVEGNRQIFAQRVAPDGTLVGSAARISDVSTGGDFRCGVANHDIAYDSSSGTYVFAYEVDLTPGTVDPCEDLRGTSKTTIARISRTLVRSPRTDLPGRFQNINGFARLAIDPTDGDVLVGRTTSTGARFTLLDAAFVPGVEQEIDLSVPPASLALQAFVTRDAATGKWVVAASNRTMVLEPDGDIAVPADLRLLGGNRFIDLVEVDDGVFLGRQQTSDILSQVDIDGNVVSHSRMPALAAGSFANAQAVAGDGGGRMLVAGYDVAVEGRAAIAAMRSVAAPAVLPLPPARLADTRNASSAETIDGQALGGGPLAGGTELRLQVAGRAGVPAGASAAMLNIAVANASQGGFATAYPCGAQRPTTSNVNFATGAATSTGAYAGLADDGTTCIFVSSDAELIVDVTGYVPEVASIDTIVPERLFESRSGTPAGTIDGRGEGGGRVGPGVTEVQVAGRGSVPVDASSVMVNVTAIRPSTNVYLTVFPCGEEQPLAANLNGPAGSVTNNLALATIGADGKVCVFSSAETDLVVDVSAVAPKGSSLQGANPARMAESRSGESTVDGQLEYSQRIAPDTSLQILISGRTGGPVLAAGVMLNVAAINPAEAGYFTIYPCGDRPTTASVNFAAGAVTSNAVFVPLKGERNVCLYTSTETDFTLDYVGSTVDGLPL